MAGAPKLIEAVTARMLAVTEVIPAVVYRYMLPHELRVSTTRQHPAVLVGPCLLAAAGFVAAAILTGLVAEGGADVLLVIWVVWLILLLRLGVKILDWMDSYFVVTSTRIMMASGAVRKKVDIIPFGMVNDITIGSTLGGRLFGCADFTISCGAPDQIIYKIAYLPDAERIFLRISSVIFPPESVPCPLCNGEGTAFLPPGSGDTATSATTGEDAEPWDGYLAPGDGRDAAGLHAAGYHEAECPRCRGRGTVPAEGTEPPEYDRP